MARKPKKDKTFDNAQPIDDKPTRVTQMDKDDRFDRTIKQIEKVDKDRAFGGKDI